MSWVAATTATLIVPASSLSSTSAVATLVPLSVSSSASSRPSASQDSTPQVANLTCDSTAVSVGAAPSVGSTVKMCSPSSGT